MKRIFYFLLTIALIGGSQACKKEPNGNNNNNNNDTTKNDTTATPKFTERTVDFKMDYSTELAEGRGFTKHLDIDINDDGAFDIRFNKKVFYYGSSFQSAWSESLDILPLDGGIKALITDTVYKIVIDTVQDGSGTQYNTRLIQEGEVQYTDTDTVSFITTTDSKDDYAKVKKGLSETTIIYANSTSSTSDNQKRWSSSILTGMYIDKLDREYFIHISIANKNYILRVLEKEPIFYVKSIFTVKD